MTRSLLVSASALVLAFALPAYGKELHPSLKPVGPIVSGDAAAKSVRQPSEVEKAQAANREFEEVVVTASRREEDLQKTSRNVIAISAETLKQAGVTDTGALQNLVPGLLISMTGGYAQVFMRGVGAPGVTAQADPAVAFNLDQVYLPRQYQPGGLFYDLERVETLKGPQGTLYGRNASGGAINIVTVRPGPDFGGYVEAETSIYDTGAWGKRLEGALNVPMADTFSMRGSFQFIERDGYLTDNYNDDMKQSGRLRALWQPNSNLSVLLSADYSHIGGKGSNAVFYPLIDRDNPWIGIADPRARAIKAAADLFAPAFGPTVIQAGNDGYVDMDTTVISATVDWNLGSVTLTAIPSYIISTVDSHTYHGGLIFDTVENDVTKAGEVRLSSNGESGFDWVIGAYASHENIKERIFFNEGLVGIRQAFSPITDLTYAAFGEGKLSITDNLRLIGGARYTYEKKTLAGTNTLIGQGLASAVLLGLPAGVATPPFPLTGTNKADNISWRVGAEYDLTPSSMLYATASTGFKAGGFFGAAVGPNTYKPEIITAYHLGSKNRFLDNRLQLNLEAFYWDYSDKQESFIGPNGAGGLTQITLNAGAATIYGLDLDVSALIGEYTTLSGQVSYASSNYDRFTYDTFIQVPPALVNTGCRITTLPNPFMNARFDCSGFQLMRSPTWSGRVGIEHIIPLAANGDIALGAQMRFSSGYWLWPEFSLRNERAEAYETSDAWITYNPASMAWSLTAYVKNIENTPIFSGAISQSSTPLVYSSIEPPRTFGVRLNYKFGAPN